MNPHPLHSRQRKTPQASLDVLAENVEGGGEARVIRNKENQWTMAPRMGAYWLSHAQPGMNH